MIVRRDRSLSRLLAATWLGVALLAGAPAAADCLDVRNPVPPLEGRLVRAVLPGPPNWTDVSRGDAAETTYVLTLKTPTCARGDEFLDGDVPIDRVQLFSSDGSMEATLERHAGRDVVVAVESAFGAHTRHHRAPLVATVVQIRASDGATSPIADAGDDEAIVRAFYAALGRGDGRAAALLVVPEKRERGPFSAGEITRFYGALAMPLALVSVEATAEGFLVHYGYAASSGRSCDGRAIVRLGERGGRRLIEAIRALDGC